MVRPATFRSLFQFRRARKAMVAVGVCVGAFCGASLLVNLLMIPANRSEAFILENDEAPNSLSIKLSTVMVALIRTDPCRPMKSWVGVCWLANILALGGLVTCHSSMINRSALYTPQAWHQRGCDLKVDDQLRCIKAY
ncbi:hypothetical protein B0H63DRAFT_458108, partial [Podospora didyma]